MVGRDGKLFRYDRRRGITPPGTNFLCGGARLWLELPLLSIKQEECAACLFYTCLGVPFVLESCRQYFLSLAVVLPLCLSFNFRLVYLALCG